MNIEEYIASGILELYVLGELSPSEMADVEEKSAQHPEIKEELLTIQETVATLSLQSAVAPRAGLKQEILDQIELNEAKAIPEPAQNNPVVPPSSTHRTITFLQYGMAASIALMLLAAVAAIYFRSQWKQTESLLEAVQIENQQIAQQYQTASQQVAQLSQDMSVASSAAYQTIAMTGLDPAPDSEAMVYWNPDSKKVYLKVNNMPDNSADKQYQLWAIVDGQPVSAGVFDISQHQTRQLIAMEDISGASAFAVTLEPKGGSESPTLDAMYVQGAVSS